MTERQPKLTETEIAALAATVNAPESLHRRVEEMVADAERRASTGRRRSWPLSAIGSLRPVPTGSMRPISIGSMRPARRIAVAATAACALAAAALLAGLSGGGSSALTVRQAAAFTLSNATMPAPRESAIERSQLRIAVEGVAFPYWRARYGWRSAGARIDRVGGRSVTTVFYSDSANRSIGYAIASGQAPPIQGGTVKWLAGVPYHVMRQDGATVVAWPRAGHLCVVAGRNMDAATLLRLAGWSRAGAGGATNA